MFDPRIKIDRVLYETLKRHAEREGYSSVDEYTRHILEKFAQGIDHNAQDEDAVKKQLQGLGYLE